MKISISEVRDIVAETVRRTVLEAKKKGQKVTPPRSEEDIEAQLERQTRATGYMRGDDFSQPLGDASVPKKQGASGIGNWTNGPKPTQEQMVRHIIRMIVREEIRAIKK